MSRILAVIVLLAGCAQSVGDIDRTQPNLLPKSMFDGRWFVRQTVTDVPVTSTFSYIGDTGGVEIIEWDIQEDMLIGYRSNEQNPGAGDDSQGSPVVMYPISSHADVIREYNPRTGESTNVIVEDTRDRPWHERDYIRVDWSKPQVNHFFFLSGVDTAASGSVFVQASEEDDEDAFRVCHEDEECSGGHRRDFSEHGAGDYFDFTERLFVVPEVRGCILDYLGEGLGDCASQEIRIRTSLMKVDEEREANYEPLVYDDERMGEFGYFRTKRVTYDRRRGTTHEGVIKLADRFDLWQDSIADDGSTIPHAERELRPVVYHLSPDYPANMLEITDRLAAEWDATFKNTAATRRGQTLEELEADLEAQTGDRCLFCVDSNEDGKARIGDLRYSFIYWVDHPQLAAPLGYGPSSPNPETGRILSGMAYVYGAAVDRHAQFAKDIVDLLNGELADEDLQDAELTRREVAGRRPAADPRASLDDVIASRLGPTAVNNLADIAEHGLPQARPGYSERRLDLVRGTPLESMLLSGEVLEGRDHQGQPHAADVLAQLSPANWATVGALQSRQAKRALAERNNLWLADFSDPTALGLARQAQADGLTGDALYQYLREQIYMAVMLHEIGHTVGLRHNFGASSDALNYFAEFWPLKQPTLNSNPQNETELLRMSCGVVDAENQAECEAQQHGRMREYQYSSIMDYGGKFNSDFQGLGRYDHAAIAAAYGDLVEVFDEDVAAQMTDAFRADVREISGWKNPLFGQINDRYHYSRLPALFGTADNIGRRHFVAREDFDPEAELRVPYVACYDEYRDATAFCHTWDEGADQHEITQHYINTYRDYYVFNNFSRGRLGFQPFDVFARVASRYFLPLVNMYQHWLFDYDPRRRDRLEQQLPALAAFDGFQLLAEVLATPQYGSYRDVGDHYEWMSYERGLGDISIEPGVGRRQFSTYDLGAGYNIFGRVVEAGMFYEQLAALLALTANDASVLGAGADVQADFLSYSIPYYLVFNDEIDRLFSSVLRSDFREFAPRVGNDGQLNFANYLSTDEEMPEGKPIELNTAFSTRLYAALFGMANTSANFDLGFSQRGQVMLLGHGESITAADGYDTLVYSDPQSGRTYQAFRPTMSVEGASDEAWYGAKLIEDNNRLQARLDNEVLTESEQLDLERDIADNVRWLEILRGLYSTFGNAI